ncbi:MAG: type I DNA topoisomerase [Bacilli bacterium]|nr:type I DNA topoisomerase [Bacilli bacterium]
MELVIVESPAKSKTIEKYLGKNYKVVSSIGHIRDLATTGKYGLGIDIEQGFVPNYVPIKGKKKVITDLKKLVKESDKVYLATDPDREGEAISWHLFDALGIKENKYDRVLFYEITKDKVLEGIKNPRKIDYNLVKSQETRRFLDRIIGFRLSKLMQSKTSGTSAGRVQSVALKLIVDREREIEAFKEEEYYTITAKFSDFDSELFKYKDKDLEIKSLDEVNDILDKLNKDFLVSSIESKNKNKASKFPFTTSTLQQEASNKLNFNARRTMGIAQKMYEGIDVGTETVGLITYMRTDSVRLSDEFTGPTFKYIEENYGKEYVGYVKKSKKTENVQDAHEAIRPTSIYRTPESIKKYLTADEYKLYNLIYKRTLASLMADAKALGTTIILDNNDYKFKTTGSVITFNGYLEVYKEFEDTKDTVLPDLSSKLNTYIESNDIIYEQHFTKPKPRYTEAKLIKEMEELGIGRPSTYATIMSNIKDRGYVEIIEKKFHPTKIGIEVTDKLQEYFSNIINVKYTANMEDDLDKIADGKIDNKEVLTQFYQVFDSTLTEAFKGMEKVAPEETGELCPECGNPLVIRKGKYGEFVACSDYPNCKYIKKEKKEENVIIDCPNCDGKIVERRSKKGKIFYGCNNYPKCKMAYWDKPTGIKCPKCSSMITEKNDVKKCSNCDYILESDNTESNDE